METVKGFVVSRVEGGERVKNSPEDLSSVETLLYDTTMVD